MAKLDKIIRNIVLGITAASTSINYAAKGEKINNGNDDGNPIGESEENSAPKLIFKENNNDGGMFLAQHSSHYSHSSHSSHHSHHSHHSHYSSSGTFTALSTKTTEAPELGARLLREGSSGEDVYQLQGLLYDNGYVWSKDREATFKPLVSKEDNKAEVKLDDTFDDVLKNVVKSFQKDKNIKQDGVVGPNTLAKLKISE